MPFVVSCWLEGGCDPGAEAVILDHEVEVAS